MILPNARQVSLYGYRGVRVGEASHPGPPKSLLRRYTVDQTARNVAAPLDVSSNPQQALERWHAETGPTVLAWCMWSQGDGFGVRVAEVVGNRRVVLITRFGMMIQGLSN